MIIFLSELFNEFGTYSPLILFFISIHLLWNNENLFFYYNIGIFINTILNLLLKGLLQQPRPTEDLKTFHLALTHGRKFVFRDGIPFNIFGMPSGHIQSAFFSTAFIYLSLRQTNILYSYLLFSFISMSQRVVYNHHTIFQVIVGAIVGTSFGYFMYYLAQQKIRGHISEKIDDYGPI